MPYTDDPIADFEAWDAEQQRKLDSFPKCVECGKRIQDDELFDIDGDLYCLNCADDLFKHSVENYIN